MKRPAHPALLSAALVSLLTLAPDAHAYLDPSTGSMILSAIVGLFATIGLALKTYWYRFKGLFRRQQAGPGAARPRGDGATQNPPEKGAPGKPAPPRDGRGTRTDVP